MCSKFFNQLHSLDKINREILTKFIPINNIRPIEIYPIFRSADFKCATVRITCGFMLEESNDVVDMLQLLW